MSLGNWVKYTRSKTIGKFLRITIVKQNIYIFQLLFQRSLITQLENCSWGNLQKENIKNKPNPPPSQKKKNTHLLTSQSSPSSIATQPIQDPKWGLCISWCEGIKN